MDTSHAEIHFDSEGVCNYCHGYDVIARSLPSPEVASQLLKDAIMAVKAAGKGKPYDCVLGLSGGVDSSFLAVKLKEWGLRPLAVSFDNGWNTELAVQNIEKICRRLDVDLHTYVVDWPEFRDLQLSFVKAGLANVEAPSDHGIFACLYRTAMEKKIKYVASGVNFATEACNPVGDEAKRTFSYGYHYSDLYHLRAVHRRFGSRPLKTFPTMGFFTRLMIERLGRVRRFEPLNLIPYSKSEAIALLQERYGWRPYEGKHGESVITRFHQAYILPVKFGMDKRKLHLSGLIWSGQISRADALEELKRSPYPVNLIAQDKEFVAKKLGLSIAEFDALMNEVPHVYTDYPNRNWLYLALWRVLALMARFRRLSRGK